MAYSSCSMNQIENEAVIAQVVYLFPCITFETSYLN